MTATGIHPLECVPKPHLLRLFDEEASLWTRDLLWNFAPTRMRLETALEEQTLQGFVATDREGACAYATYAADGEHGIVGSFFTASRARSQGIEGLLVAHSLDRLLAEKVRVIDCQTLFSSDPGLLQPFSAKGFTSAKRLYMTLDRDTWIATRRPATAGVRSKPCHRTDLRALARLIHDAHADSRDLDASSSFDTIESCERILRQIMVEEICGPFDSMGSRRVESSGRAMAASLLTWPLPVVAHVSEVATAPAHRRLGLARRCLTESLESAFERGNASAVTLSVTASNLAAVALYESMGFLPRIRYESHVLRETPL